jgi:predicted aldo/keto reductase-like oxidoreductase
VKEQMQKQFEGSLKRLQMDHVDILYYHDVRSGDEAAMAGPMEFLTAMKKAGKTRFIGLSSHQGQAQVLTAAMKAEIYDVALIGFNYQMADDKATLDAIAEAGRKGMGLVAMKTQSGGLNPWHAHSKPLPPHSQPALLKWVLQHKEIATAIPGLTNFEELEQNFACARNLDFTPAEKDFLGDKGYFASAEFCTQCGDCKDDCPKQADIPTLMRSHMYAVQYRNHEHARITLASMDAGRGLDACADCASCQAKCTKTVNIAGKIAELKQIHPVILQA